MAAVELPRYVVFTGDNGCNLCLDTNAQRPFLRFNSKKPDSLEVQEMIPVPGQKNVYMIKNVYNQLFWERCPTVKIFAEHSGTPSTENLNCLFKVVQINPKKVALLCLANNRYLHRWISKNESIALAVSVTDCFKHATAQLEFSEANPVKLPRFVIFKGDNEKYLCLYSKSNYLQFNSKEKDSWALHEVIPVPAGHWNMVMIKSLHNNQFWRWGTNWIWADQSGTPSTDNNDCLFKVVQISPNVVALQCLANNCYLQRLPDTDNKVDCLNASAGDWRNVPAAQLEVIEGVITRRVFDVIYLWDQMDTTDMEPVILGTVKAVNNRETSTIGLQTTITYDVETESTWSNATTITAGGTMTLTAKVPEIAEASVSQSLEFSNTYQFGETKKKKESFSTNLTVNDVAPGDTVEIKVEATRATASVPYSYKVQEKRVDNATSEVETAVDGIFKGVQVLNINWVATDSSGNRKPTVVHENKLVREESA